MRPESILLDVDRKAELDAEWESRLDKHEATPLQKAWFACGYTSSAATESRRISQYFAAKALAASRTRRFGFGNSIREVIQMNLTKDELFDIGRRFNPSLTREEFDRMWEEFVRLKEETIKRRSVQ